MPETRNILEKKQHIKSQLTDYKFTQHSSLDVETLQIGDFVRWIKKATETEPAHVVRGGRISEITPDRDDPTKIFRITITTNVGNQFKLKLKDATNFYFYYKQKTKRELKLAEAAAWKDNLDPVEKARLTIMQKKRAEIETKAGKKRKTDEFYSWLYKRKPELNPKLKPKPKLKAEPKPKCKEPTKNK
jgi:hypothetical protein